MKKTPVPLLADDITSFSRALARQLGPTSPPHLLLMNMLARAAGFQNLQHMQAQNAAAIRLGRPTKTPLLDARAVEQALNQFDSSGRLRRWPAKRTVQTLALWALWAVFPAGTSLSEREVNMLLQPEHLFGDPATLRRTMISCKLLTRKPDGTEYRRIEREPPAEAKAVIRSLTPLRRARSPMLEANSHA
jgi:hypothetical protein